MPGAGRYPGLVGDFFVEEFMLEGNGSQKPRKCFGKSRGLSRSVLNFMPSPPTA